MDVLWSGNLDLSSDGDQVLSLQPPLLRNDRHESKYYLPQGGIIFSLSKKVTIEELIDAVNKGDVRRDEPYIMDLLASPGRELNDLK